MNKGSILSLFPILFLGSVIIFPQPGYSDTERSIKPFPDAVPLTVCNIFPASMWTIDPMQENRDFVTADLFTNIKRLSSQEKSFGTLLSEASCWHLLFRAGIDSAMGMSEGILHSLSRMAPRSPEIAWVSGMNQLWSGKVNKGLHILHALTVAEFNDNNDLVRDYLKICAHCLLPSNFSAFTDKILLNAPSCPGWDIFSRVEETFPETITLKEFHRSGFDSLPSLVLSATFTMTPLRSLDFSMVKGNGCQLVMNFDSSITASLSGEQMNDLFTDQSKMEIQIFALPGIWLFPAEAQIVSMIHGRFDYVRKVDDLERFGAVGIRCKKNSIFRDAVGSYYAFIGFDASVSGNKGKISIKPLRSRTGKDTIPVRYFIVLKSCDDITSKAERILQNVLSCFSTSN